MVLRSFSTSIQLVLRGEPELSLPAGTIHDDDVHRPADSGSPWRTWEDEIILKYVEAHGPKWAEIASLLPGRTDNSCRNRHQRMMKNLGKYGDIVDAMKSGYRSNSKSINKNQKAKKAGPKSEHHTESEPDDDTVLLIDPCEMDQTVLPSEEELFSNILPPGDYEIFALGDLVTTTSPERNYRSWQSTMSSSGRSDDELLRVIFDTASVLADGSV
tara:strand:+ start:196 stop:840 length:645 start_codon:yes stop_codon:yes gene_type:complete